MQVPLPPNALLRNGRYIIEALYKRGGQALVYLGHDIRSEQRVVIKQTYREYTWAREALQHEAELLAHLGHSSLPQVIDTFEEQEDTYLVMSYVPGHDLGEMMNKRGSPFAVAEVMGWAEQLLNILDYLQRQDAVIIHRDINPKNLRLTSENRLFLLDFGIAKKAYSKTLLLGGTPHYAPPEQLKDEGTDQRSDLYSLAATLYYLLTAVEPPDALSRDTARLKGLPDPLVAASEINPQVPLFLSRVLSQTMSLDREDRPSSALSLLSKLRGEDPDAETSEDIKTVVSPRSHEGIETTDVMGKGGDPHKRSNAIVVALERSSGRDATAEALQLLSALDEGPAIDDDLVQITLELMDSSPSVKPKVLKRYARILDRHQADGSQVALEFINLLGANSYLEPEVKARLRQHLGRIMAGRHLDSLSSNPDEEHDKELIVLEDLIKPEHVYDTRLQRKWLRNLLVWIVRGIIIAVAIQICLLLFAGQRTLVDGLSWSSGHALFWSNLFFIAYSLFLLTLIRKLNRTRLAEKKGDNVWAALLGLCYGLASTSVLLHDLLTLLR